MSLFKRRLPQQRQVFRNNGMSALEVMVELIPHRYVLQPGDEMVILADAPPSNEGFTINAYDGGLQVYAAWDLEPAVSINGKPATPDWSTPGPNDDP